MRYSILLTIAFIGTCLALNSTVIEKKLIQATELIKVPNNHSKCLQAITHNVDYIKKYFEDIKSKVNSRNTMLQRKVNEYSDQMINNINAVQVENEKKSEEMKDLYNSFEGIKLKLHELINGTSDEMQSKLKEFKPKVDNILSDYRKILFGKEFKLSFSQLGPKEIFGTFNGLSHDQFGVSTILTPDLSDKLVKLCMFESKQNWKLIYRASEDGFDADFFHSKCDSYGDTLTIIKATSGNIFGGWTEENFGGYDNYESDSSAFIFSLVNKENKPFVANIINPDTAIYSASNYGPTFGGGHDIYISSDSNSNEDSYTYFGNSYTHPSIEEGDFASESILAGSYNFKTTDIEVWHNFS